MVPFIEHSPDDKVISMENRLEIARGKEEGETVRSDSKGRLKEDLCYLYPECGGGYRR